MIMIRLFLVILIDIYIYILIINFEFQYLLKMIFNKVHMYMEDKKNWCRKVYERVENVIRNVPRPRKNDRSLN